MAGQESVAQCQLDEVNIYEYLGEKEYPVSASFGDGVAASLLGGTVSV